MNTKKIRYLYLDEKRSIKEVADELNFSFWKVYNAMKKDGIQRRGSSEANYIKYDKYKPKFYIKESTRTRDEYLKIAA